MGVQLSAAEMAEYLDQAHTIIVSTIDKDGFPHSVPMWFVLLDGAIYFRTMAHQQKAVNLRRNPKIGLLAEDGEAWVDLRAVLIRGEAAEVTDPAEIDRFEAAFDRKYADFRLPDTKLGGGTQRHYSRPRVYLKVPLAGARIASWYNRKVRLKA